MIYAVFAHMMIFYNKLKVGGSTTEGLPYDNRCNMANMSSWNCTTAVFCSCQSGRHLCHDRLDVFCRQYKKVDIVCLKTGECITYENETAMMGLCPYYPKHLG